MKRSLFLLHCLASLKAAAMDQESFRLLCFGDSLTAGYTDRGTSTHPYAVALGDSLRKSFPTLNVTTDLQGLSGDQVRTPPGGFLPRMDILYEEATQPYTYAIILGGTNDLTLNCLPKDLLKALEAVWAIPLSHGAKVLALTVPESGNAVPVVNTRRSKSNELILEHEAKNFYKLDLSRKIPYFNMPEDERKIIWDDGTHFTPAGYDLVGTIIAARIVEIEKAEGRGNVGNQDVEKGELKKRDLWGAAAKRRGKILRSGRVVVREVEGTGT